MPDDKSKRGTSDRQRVSAKEPYEVKRLATKTGLPVAVVEKVIQQEGPMRSKVESYLERMKKNAR